MSWKDIVRGKGEKAWILGVTKDEHSHAMVPNPLSFDIHRKQQPEHATAIVLAITHRQANISYRQSSQLLAIQGLRIPPKVYYNSQ